MFADTRFSSLCDMYIISAAVVNPNNTLEIIRMAAVN